MTAKTTYDAVFPAERLCDVTLTLRGGQKHSAQKVAARGNYDAPLSDDALLEKFDLFAGTRLSPTVRKALKRIITAPSHAPSAGALLEQI